MEVLLGLLTIQPMSGYDLGLTVREAVGHFWNESYGQIYPSLKKLAAAGFVSSRAERQKGKPDRRIYSIAPKGRERLAAWLAVPPQPEVSRNELLMKLFFGPQIAPQILIGYVERMAQSERESLLEFKRIEQEDIAAHHQYPGAPYWKMVARFGQTELEAHLRWAEETLAELNRIVKKQGRPGAGREKKHARK
jgi:PadR family transcriptional regulator AphA